MFVFLSMRAPRVVLGKLWCSTLPACLGKHEMADPGMTSVYLFLIAAPVITHSCLLPVVSPKHSTLRHHAGESERVVSRLFSEAKKAVPSIIFFDEIDALVRRDSVHFRMDGTLMRTVRMPGGSPRSLPSIIFSLFSSPIHLTLSWVLYLVFRKN